MRARHGDTGSEVIAHRADGQVVLKRREEVVLDQRGKLRIECASLPDQPRHHQHREQDHQQKERKVDDDGGRTAADVAAEPVPSDDAYAMYGRRDPGRQHGGDEDENEDVANQPQEQQHQRDGDDHTDFFREEVEIAIAALLPGIEGHPISYPRYWRMAASICVRGTAPTTRPFSTPSLKSTRSGMLMARYVCAERGFRSTFNFANRTSERDAAISSITGAIIRHGPHHAAQKSTRKLPLRIVSAKFASVSSIGCPPVNGVLHLPQTAFLLGSSGNRLAWPQFGHRTTSFMRGTIAKGGPSRLREGERFTRRRGGAEKGVLSRPPYSGKLGGGEPRWNATSAA